MLHPRSVNLQKCFLIRFSDSTCCISCFAKHVICVQVDQCSQSTELFLQASYRPVVKFNNLKQVISRWGVTVAISGLYERCFLSGCFLIYLRAASGYVLIRHVQCLKYGWNNDVTQSSYKAQPFVDVLKRSHMALLIKRRKEYENRRTNHLLRSCVIGKSSHSHDDLRPSWQKGGCFACSASSYWEEVIAAGTVNLETMF